MKVIVLTGISKGIGKALHDRLVLNDHINIFLGRRMSKYICGLNKIYLDIDLELLNESMLLQITLELNSINNIEEIIFINNAGVLGPIKAIGEYSIEEIKSVEKINSISPKILINHLCGISKKNKYNLTIFNITSGAASRPITGWSLYCSTKSSIISFLNVLEKDNPNINIINYDPGVVDTDIQKQIRRSNKECFPDLEVFQKYKKNNMLAKPVTVALDIMNKLNL